MKRVLLYICIALATIGCAKDADVTPSSDNALTITSNITTRVANEQWEANDDIGVYMTSSTFGDKGENVEYTTADGSGDFLSTTPLYYPASGEVDIFAYYPYKSGVDLEAYPIDSAEQIDLLSAVKSGVAKSSSAVSLVFEHLLSMISLTIIAGDGLEDSDLDNLGVKISGISTTATFDVTNSCVNSNSLGTVTEFELSTTEAGTSSSAILIPQSLSDATLYFTTKEYGTFFVTLSTTEFMVGNEYKYTATINRDGVEITSENIDKWEENIDSGSANIVDIELKDDIYYINTGAGLEAFADLVNGVVNTTAVAYGDFSFSDEAKADINGVLTRNIDLSDVCGADVGESGTNWTPIGYSSSTPFSGTFDGGGYEIRELYISSTNQLALFGYVDEDGEVYNFGISGNVTSTNGSSAWQTAGVVANNYGLVINCYSLVNVSGGTNVGSIAAYNEGSVVNCYNQGSVEGETNVGGIVGQNETGGYVGYCYSMGYISNEATRVGGIVGYNHSTTDEAPTIKGSFCLDNTTYSIGQLEYAAVSGGLTTNVCDEEYLTSEVFAIIINNGAWTYNNTYKSTITIPACAWVDNSAKQDYTTLDFGVAPIYNDKVYDIIYNGDTYEIYSTKGLKAFADLVNGGGNTGGVTVIGANPNFDSTNTSINGRLMCNVDLSTICYKVDGTADGDVSWTAMGGWARGFNGTFDGDGYTVSGLYLNISGNDQGFFGYVETQATITNLGVEGSVIGVNYVGAIVGINYGAVINCYSSGEVIGNDSNGGIIGVNAGTVNCCYSRATVVSNTSSLGGVVGQTDNSNITNCYYDVTVAGYIGTVNGGDSGTNYCGLTTEQMKGDAATEGTLLYYLTDLSQGNSSAWVADTSGINDGYPILTRQTIND